jgi:hypothetical protein
MLGLVLGVAMGLAGVVMTEWMWSPADVFRGRLVLGGLGVFAILMVVAGVTGELHEWLLVGFCLSWGASAGFRRLSGGGRLTAGTISARGSCSS